MKKLVIICLALFSTTAFAYPVGEKGVDRMVSHIPGWHNGSRQRKIPTLDEKISIG